MLKKRAEMTWEEIFGLILTCAIILFFFIPALASMLNLGSLESNQAKGLLQNIVNTLNNSNQGDTVSLFVYVPKNWWVVATNPKSVKSGDTGTTTAPTDLKPLSDVSSEESKNTPVAGTGHLTDIKDANIPFEFSGKTVVCICPNKKALIVFKTFNVDCSAKGAVCAEISKPLIPTQKTSLTPLFYYEQIDLARELKVTNNQADYLVTEEITLEVAPATLNEEEKGLCVTRLPKYESYISAASKEFGVEEALIKATICAESSGYVLDIGTSGEVGLMQIMPQNAYAWKKETEKVFDPDNYYNPKNPTYKKSTENWDVEKNHPGYNYTYIAALKNLIKAKSRNVEALSLEDVRFNPERNIQMATGKYIKDNLKACPTIEGAIAKYNCNQCNVKYSKGVTIYVANVMGYYTQFKSNP